MKFVKIATEGAILTPISKIPWTCPHENLTSGRTKVVLTAVNVLRFNERYKIAIFSATLPLSPMGNELLLLRHLLLCIHSNSRQLNFAI